MTRSKALWACLLGVLVITVIAGCGSSKPSTVQVKNKGADLVITTNFPRVKTVTYKCLPNGGAGVKTCSTSSLSKLETLITNNLGGVQSNCQAVYGGPGNITVTGFLQGKKISTRFTEASSCQVTSYKALSSLVGLG
jgi:hypothetical protein